jgi:hypothetical protein
MWPFSTRPRRPSWKPISCSIYHLMSRYIPLLVRRVPDSFLLVFFSIPSQIGHHRFLDPRSDHRVGSIPSYHGLSARTTSKLTPRHRDRRNICLNDRDMKRDAKTVSGWDFTRIIPCHGVLMFICCGPGNTDSPNKDVIEEGGKKAWDDAYSVYLG